VPEIITLESIIYLHRHEHAGVGRASGGRYQVVTDWLTSRLIVRAIKSRFVGWCSRARKDLK